MAPKTDDEPRVGRIVGSAVRDGAEYPTVRLAGGEAPRKGSTIRVRLDNDVVYTAKVVSASQEILIETDGLEPERADEPAAGSDVVPG